MKKVDPGKHFDDKGFATPDDLSKGVKVWIPHTDDGWRSASIVECSDYEHVIVLDEKSQEVSKSLRIRCFQRIDSNINLPRFLSSIYFRRLFRLLEALSTSKIRLFWKE